jgi:hypothetical protein
MEVCCVCITFERFRVHRWRIPPHHHVIIIFSGEFSHSFIILTAKLLDLRLLFPLRVGAMYLLRMWALFGSDFGWVSLFKVESCCFPAGVVVRRRSGVLMRSWCWW